MNNTVNAIIICPCCATPKDVTASDPKHDNEQYFECAACGQEWSMVVDADRLKDHALT